MVISRTYEEKWHFTKSQADSMYKRAIKESKKPAIPGVPNSYMKRKVNRQWFYRVNHLHPGEQRNYMRDLWGGYGFLTYYSPDNVGFYVRRG
jgi:hypothetical protein